MSVNWLIDLLEDADVATFGTDLFVSLEPDMNNIIVIYPTAGAVDIASNAYQYDTQGLQINVIGTYAYASAKIKEIHRLVAGNEYVIIQTNPSFVEVNPKGRRVFTASYIRSEIGGGGSRLQVGQLFDLTFDETFA